MKKKKQLKLFEQMTPPELVAAIREKCGPADGKLSQAALAEHLGVSGQTVWRWENGKVKPHNNFIKALRRCYKDGF